MPDNAATKAADYATTHTFKILRVAAGQRLQAFAQLKALEQELAGLVESAGPNPTLQSAKYKAMQADAQVAIADTYRLLAKTHGKGLEDLASLEWQASNQMVNSAVGVDIVSGKIPPKILESVTKAPVVLGHSAADWWNGQSADFRQKFQAQMAQGTLLGETTPQLLKRLRGAGVFETPVPGSPQGIVSKAKRDAESLILTSASSIANEARMQSFREKSDLIKGVQWLATLDGRTTLICISLDGKQWRFPDMKPVGHDKAWPGVTAHWRCRSTQISVLYSWAELSGKKLPSLDNHTLQERVDSILEKSGMPAEKIAAARVNARASMDGQVAKTHTYESWAKTKGSAFIEQTIGPGRAALYNAGDMTFSDLTNQNNRPLTIQQLAHSIETKQPPPETLGVEFHAPPVTAKYDAERKAAEEAAKLAAKAEQDKADALQKATLLAEMKLAYVETGNFTPTQLAMWNRLPQEEKDVYLADWQAAKVEKKKAAQAAFAAEQAKQKAAQEALIAQKAAEEAAKQAALKAKQEADAAAKKLADELAAKHAAELAAAKKAADEAAAKAKAELAAALAKVKAEKMAQAEASIVAKQIKAGGLGGFPVTDEEAAYLASLNEAGQQALNAKIDEGIKAAKLAAKAAKASDPVKLEKSIAKKYATAGQTGVPAKLTVSEKAYLDSLDTAAHSALQDTIDAQTALLEKKAAKKAKLVPAASTIPPENSAAVVPPSLSAPDLAAKNQDLYFPDPSGLKVVKTLPGSTAPKLVLDPTTGKQWVLKEGGGGGDHLKAEALADKMYRSLGASVPGSHYGESKGKPYKIAEYIDGVQTLSEWKKTASPAEIVALHGELKKNFVADALFANWDVAGLSNDNILVKDGKPIRIDNGGSLMYRAQGGLKAAADWGPKVLDLKTLRDAKKNPNTAEIFKGIKQSDIDEQIVAIVAKKDELVHSMNDAFGSAQAKILSDRIDNLAAGLPASKRPAPKDAVVVGDLILPPKFEEHVATRFGSSAFAGGGEFEDQQLQIWRERDTSKNDLVKAQGVLTLSASNSFVSQISALGLDTKSAVKPTASFISSKAHPEDTFWPAIQAAAKTVSAHAADGKYNSTTLFAFNEAKKKLIDAVAATTDPDKKAMLAHYGLAMVEIDKAIVAKTAVGTVLKPYEVPSKPATAAAAANAPTDQIVVNGVTISRSTTNRITYTVKTVVNGVLEDTGQTNRDVQTPAAYKLQRGNVEVTVVPYEVAPGSQRSYQGIVRINVKGSDPTTALPEAMALMKDAGLIKATQPTTAQKELVYLQKGFYLRDDHARPEYVSILQSGASDEEKVKQIKALAKTLYGVTLPDKPSGFHRYYNPDGELPASTAGARFWRRWDEPLAVLKKAEKDSAFFHQGRIGVAVKAWLTDGGHTTSTIQRLRTGVPLSSGGASSDSDLSMGGGNFFYTNFVKSSTASKMKKEGIYFSGDSVTRLDLASHTGDSYGAWEYQQGARRRRTIEQIQQGSGIGICINTGLHKNGISMENVTRVKMDTPAEAAALISEIRALGINSWPDGRKLEDVIK